MKYAILCYDSKSRLCLDEGTGRRGARRLDVVKEKLRREGGSADGSLMPTTTAMTSEGQGGIVLDGPFAETKEQLLGFYVVECDSLEQAIERRRTWRAAAISGCVRGSSLEVVHSGSVPA